jgi:hypothetical protein
VHGIGPGLEMRRRHGAVRCGREASSTARFRARSNRVGRQHGRLELIGNSLSPRKLRSDTRKTNLTLTLRTQYPINALVGEERK